MLDEIKMCACIGPVGKDPYCACEMQRRGIMEGDYVWTEEDKEHLRVALTEIMWDESKDE